jgi:hypothetical protein
MKYSLTTLLILSLGLIYGQESLLLGELKLNAIQTTQGKKNLEEVIIYGKKYKNSGNYKDSVVKGTIYYSSRGNEINRTTYSGKNNENTYVRKYFYNLENKVVSIDNQMTTNGEVLGKSWEFYYNEDGLISRQIISLANITYNYSTEGKIKNKKYYYNNGNGTFGEPFIILFEYDFLGNLIHADADTSGSLQTSFYNDKNELIRHDYYPAVAYTTYRYDENGNCIEQMDFEISNKGWDSIQYVFTYDSNNRLLTSATTKKGKAYIDQEFIYFEDGRLKAEILYRKNKKRWVNRYYYQYYPFKG